MQKPSPLRLLHVILLLPLLTSACSVNYSDDTINRHGHRTNAESAIHIDGLRPCSTSADTALYINSDDPVIVLTHGCLDSVARFKALAKVFAFQGQQAICFTYDDRDSLLKSASELTGALKQLSTYLDDKHITVIAHSQGGLIARKAMTDQFSAHVWQGSQSEVSLVTISTPFSGIEVASHCGSDTWRSLSLGLVDAICWIISGDKWFEITDSSDFIQKPGALMPRLGHHYKIDTDERHSCRSIGAGNRCMESDFVFSLNEQHLGAVEQRAEVKHILVQAGHTEIVGDVQTPPHKLIGILQQQGIMKQTQPEQQGAMRRLLSRLY
ncbi:MAG: alpha/beta hydrolase [Mariprofundaceae bacterium]